MNSRDEKINFENNFAKAPVLPEKFSKQRKDSYFILRNFLELIFDFENIKCYFQIQRLVISVARLLVAINYYY